MIDLLANESRENRRPGTPTLIHTLQKPIELTPIHSLLLGKSCTIKSQRLWLDCFGSFIH